MKHEAAPDAKAAASLLRDLFRHPPQVVPRCVDRPLALYGAGNLGRLAKNYFAKLGIPIEFVVDANPSVARQDPFWAGTIIQGLEETSSDQCMNNMLAVCVATSPFSEIHDRLAELGWKDIVPFYDIAQAYRDRHPLGNGWFSGRLAEDDLRRLEGVLSSWEDDVSRAHHLQFIAWHSHRQDWFFNGAAVTLDDRYFIPQVRELLHGREAFMDVGAHHGEVTSRFVEIVQQRFQAIWAIEPDMDNFPRLCRVLESLPYDPDRSIVRPLHLAVGAQPEAKRFIDGLGYASQLCGYGQRTIQVTTLDQLALSPTFIKLHLEGAELAAIKGALQTIRRHRPILAATSYHNSLGLWEFPEWLADHLTDYRFLFRAHSWCGTGTVIYCIPTERRSTS